MIIKTLAHRGIALDPARFKPAMKARKDVLSSVPLYTPPDENGALRRSRVDVEAMLPEAPVQRRPHRVVCVAVVVSSRTVIYVGSTTHLWERVKTHKTGDNNGDDWEIYKYLADNDLVIGEGVVIVPIWTGTFGTQEG